MKINVGENKIKELTIRKFKNRMLNIWSENNDGQTNRAANQIENILLSMKNDLPKDFKFPKIVVTKKETFGKYSFGAYDHKSDMLYIPNWLSNKKTFASIFPKNYFRATDFETAIKHEIGHKLHWDNVIKFYNENKKKYNNLKSAKQDFDKLVRMYIKQRLLEDSEYLEKAVSKNASYAWKYDSNINEIYAEAFSKPLSDKKLQTLVKEALGL